jgi:hypothetical protein
MLQSGRSFCIVITNPYSPPLTPALKARYCICIRPGQAAASIRQAGHSPFST